MSKILSTSVLGFAGMYQWKVGDLGAHTSFLLVQRNTFSSYASSVATCWTGETLKDSNKAAQNLEFSLVTWVCKADSITIQLND